MSLQYFFTYTAGRGGFFASQVRILSVAIRLCEVQNGCQKTISIIFCCCVGSWLLWCPCGTCPGAVGGTWRSGGSSSSVCWSGGSLPSLPTPGIISLLSLYTFKSPVFFLTSSYPHSFISVFSLYLKISSQFQYLQFPFNFFKKVENVEDGED
jgi:hypothetical protein